MCDGVCVALCRKRCMFCSTQNICGDILIHESSTQKIGVAYNCVNIFLSTNENIYILVHNNFHAICNRLAIIVIELYQVSNEKVEGGRKQ